MDSTCIPSWPLIPTPMCAVLIMETSLAPSPIDSVTACLYFLTRSTTMAFWSGVTRQQITALPAEQFKSIRFRGFNRVGLRRTLSSDVEEEFLQFGLQGVHQRVAVDDQRVARVAVILAEASLEAHHSQVSAHVSARVSAHVSTQVLHIGTQTRRIASVTVQHCRRFNIERLELGWTG